MKAGAKALPADLVRWREPGGFRPGWYFLLRPRAGTWPAGATLDLTVSCYPGKLRVKVGTARDVAPPVAGAFEAPKRVTGKTRYGKDETHLFVPFGAVADAAPLVCVRVRLVDPATRAAAETEAGFRTAHAGAFTLPPEHPSCLAAGAVADTAGNVATLPAAACAKGLPADLLRPVATPCAAPPYDDKMF